MREGDNSEITKFFQFLKESSNAKFVSIRCMEHLGNLVYDYLNEKKFGRNPRVFPTRFATEAIRFSLLLDFYPQIAEFVTQERQTEQVLEYGSDYLKFHVSFVILLFGIS
ncbi:hypothetical protein M0811_04648 [Anaeramoeba ignava]|uniref:Uncharacterized protein n=1 Tax=Anaeramoeba ignava TaxID=1746090 RepID=A0A9Q0LUG8_ANAIG|nr:hypothetical protein M0811_04648 [Anaeramoeba ignava]